MGAKAEERLVEIDTVDMKRVAPRPQLDSDKMQNESVVKLGCQIFLT